MKLPSLTLALALAAAGALATAPVAQGRPEGTAPAPPAAKPAPPKDAPPKDAPPPAPAPPVPEGAKPVKTAVVFRQPRVEFTSRIYDQVKKILPAGPYDVSLVSYEYSNGATEFAFELRKPNQEPLAAVLKDVRQQVVSPRAAAAYLGLPLPGEKKAKAEKAAKVAAAEAASKGEEPPPAPEQKKEKRNSIVAPVFNDGVRLSYWTKTPLKTVQIYTVTAKIPPTSVQ